jgi:hypothetical protein
LNPEGRPSNAFLDTFKKKANFPRNEKVLVRYQSRTSQHRSQTLLCRSLLTVYPAVFANQHLVHYFYHALVKKHTKPSKDFPDLSIPTGRPEIMQFWPDAGDHQSKEVELTASAIARENKKWKRTTGLYQDDDDAEQCDDTTDSEDEGDSHNGVPVLVWRPDFTNASAFR